MNRPLLMWLGNRRSKRSLSMIDFCKPQQNRLSPSPDCRLWTNQLNSLQYLDRRASFCCFSRWIRTVFREMAFFLARCSSRRAWRCFRFSVWRKKMQISVVKNYFHNLNPATNLCFTCAWWWSKDRSFIWRLIGNRQLIHWFFRYALQLVCLLLLLLLLHRVHFSNRLLSRCIIELRRTRGCLWDFIGELWMNQVTIWWIFVIEQKICLRCIIIYTCWAIEEGGIWITLIVVVSNKVVLMGREEWLRIIKTNCDFGYIYKSIWTCVLSLKSILLTFDRTPNQSRPTNHRLYSFHCYWN